MPRTYQDWEKGIQERKLTGETLHAAKLASGSKIGYDQFLLLRVLWEDHGRGQLLSDEVNQLIPKAKQMLDGYTSWKTYCANFGQSKTPEGNFTMAYHYQRMATKTKETSPDSFDTPIAKRTRSRVQGKFPDVSKLQLNPTTPLKQSSKEPQTPLLQLLDGDDDDDNDGGDDLTFEESPSPPSPPVTPAAQIVNTALLIFLSALTIHFAVSENCDWSMHRKALVAEFGAASFVARTDGYLDDGQENPYALIEVKPVLRYFKRRLIQMQESAQMVAWIKTDVDTKASLDKLRIHVSQDRHEIYIIIAEYHDDYLTYLKGESPKNEKDAFLTMHQYGPWDTQNASSMRELGPILLAITLHGEAEMQRARQR